MRQRVQTRIPFPTEEEMYEALNPYWNDSFGYYLPHQGWWPIVLDTHRQLKVISNEYRIHQIKEKFGGLRYYFSMPDQECYDKAQEIIKEAEVRAAGTCEYCGGPGKLRCIGRWYHTTCDSCSLNDIIKYAIIVTESWADQKPMGDPIYDLRGVLGIVDDDA